MIDLFVGNLLIQPPIPFFVEPDQEGESGIDPILDGLIQFRREAVFHGKINQEMRRIMENQLVILGFSDISLP